LCDDNLPRLDGLNLHENAWYRWIDKHCTLTFYKSPLAHTPAHPAAPPWRWAAYMHSAETSNPLLQGVT
jgi:hypothetical protein